MARTVLEVVMAADPRSLERGFQRGEKATDKFAKTADKSSKKASKSFAGTGVSVGKLAKAATGLGAAYLSISGAKSAISVTEDLGKASLLLSRNLGISTDEASRFAAVAKVRGIDIKALSTGFGTLSKNAVAAANGGKSQIKSFQALGISLKDVKAGTTDFTGLIGSLADGFEKTEAGPARTAAALKILGKGYQTLGPLISAGSEGLKEQLALADKYGITLNGKTIKSVKDLGAAQREQQFASLGLQIQIGSLLLPAVTKLNETMLKIRGPITQFVVGIQESTGAGGKFADVINRISGAVTSTVTYVGSLVAAFKRGDVAVVAATSVLAALTAGYVAFRVSVAITNAVTKAQIALNLALDANPVGLVVIGIVALSAALFVAYQKSEQFRKVVDTTFASLRVAAVAVLPTVKDALANVGQAVSGVANVVRNMVKVVQALLNGDFRAAWSGVKGIVSGALSAGIGAIKAWFAPGRAAARALGGAVISGLKSGVSKAGDIVSGIADGVRGRIGDLKHFFLGLGKSIISAVANGIKSAPGALINAIQSAVPGPLRGAAKLIPGNPLGFARGGMFAATQGVADRPYIITGEQAPRHPEFVIPTNPAYRGRAQQLLGQAGKAIEYQGFQTGGVVGPNTVSRMQSWANSQVAKNYPYVYGGGHGALGVANGGFDCSGFVSGILGVGGVIGSPMAVRQPLQGALVPGPGKYVTVGIRGTSARNAHTMIKVGSSYYESGGGGNGAHKRAGWNGAFDLFHPANEAAGAAAAAPGKTSAGANGSGAGSVRATAPKKKAITSAAAAYVTPTISPNQSAIADVVSARRESLASSAGDGPAGMAAAAADMATDLASYNAAKQADAEYTASEAIDRPRRVFRNAISSMNADYVRAQVDTPDDKTDDIAVLTNQLNSAAAGYADAIQRGDSDGIIEFGNQLQGLRSDLKALQDAVTENTSSMAAAIAEYTRALDEQRRLATSQIGIESSTIVKALADILSGQIIGRDYRGAAQTAGAGTTVRY